MPRYQLLHPRREIRLQRRIVLQLVRLHKRLDMLVRRPFLPVALIPADVKICIRKQPRHLPNELVEELVGRLPRRVHRGVHNPPPVRNRVRPRPAA